MSNSPKTLVLGIGNTLLGDEGAGVRAMELMRDSHRDPGVEYIDGGTLSFTLTRYIEEADHLIVIDAANFDGDSGDWRCFVDEAMDEFLSDRGRSVHEVSLSDLMDIARLTGRLPRRRALLGIQTRDVDWGESLSPAVSRAVRAVVNEAWRLVLGWRGESLPAD